MHNGLGYIYDEGLRPARKVMSQKDSNMSIEQFIENEVKSNDVVLFMKGTPAVSAVRVFRPGGSDS